MSKFIVFVLIVSVCIVFSSCSVLQNQNVSPTTQITQLSEEKSLTIPEIERFCATEFEQYDYVFSSVESAVFLHDGKKEKIAPSDPRLIRLLNSLCYSYNNYYTMERQGIVEEAEINTYLSCDLPILDISLSPSDAQEQGHEIARAHRVVICANSYLLFISPEKTTVLTEGKIYAYQHWPFLEILLAPYEANSDESTSIWNSDWGESTWIDILDYAGFNSEDSLSDPY